MQLREALADHLLQLRKHHDAIQHYQRLVRQQPEAWPIQRKLCLAFLSLYQLEEAEPLLRQLVKQFPQDEYITHLLAATLLEQDQKQEGHEVLHGYYLHTPSWYQAAKEKPAPTLLQIYGVSQTPCYLGHETGDEPDYFFRGGHFTTRFLLRSQRFHRVHWTISEENLLHQQIPSFDVLLNTIADSDVELQSLLTLEQYLRQQPETIIINHPQAVLQTTRDVNYQRLNQREGITFPRTERLLAQNQTVETLLQEVEKRDFHYPLIVRLTGTQTARSVFLAHNRRELEAGFRNNPGAEYYLIQYVLIPYQGKKLFNKMRMFCIDGQLYPVVSHVDNVWNVHGKHRLTVMKQNPWMQEQEKQFLANPMQHIGEENYQRLQALYEFIKLDFFGIDFCIQEDGTLFVFELNAAMRHSFAHADNFSYMVPYMTAISRAFLSMVFKRLNMPALEVSVLPKEGGSC